MQTQKTHRRMIGEVVSTKMQKTIVVRVDRVMTHPKYGKQYRLSERFKVHDEAGKAQMGDQVTIEECRPVSKDKRWRLVESAKKTV